MNWYIKSKNNDERYLEKVRQTVGPCMEYFCERLYQVDTSELDKIKIIFREIIEELPILNFIENKDDFYISYNKDTSIMFNDKLTGIIRDIKLSKILA